MPADLGRRVQARERDAGRAVSRFGEHRRAARVGPRERAMLADLGSARRSAPGGPLRRPGHAEIPVAFERVGEAGRDSPVKLAACVRAGLSDGAGIPLNLDTGH